jgi:hypothetical protein
VWSGWRSALIIVKPNSVIAWHRKSFRLFWKVRRGRPGRPGVPKNVRERIRRLSRENPLWGAPRIPGELPKLGIDVGETSVGKYLVRHRQPPSQSWRTFLENPVQTMVSVDFFTVPTIRFQVRYVFLVLAHDRRRIVPFNVTAHPTADWTAHQLREAFPFDQVPRYLHRDRHGILGREFRSDVKAMGIQEVLSTPRSPWERALVECVIGTIRRECLDPVIVFHPASLHRHVKSFLAYYHEFRTHLAKDSQEPRPRLLSGMRSRCCDTASRRTSSPVRAARRLNWRNSPRRRSCPGGQLRHFLPAMRREDTPGQSWVGVVPSSRRNVQPVPGLLGARWELR